MEKKNKQINLDRVPGLKENAKIDVWFANFTFEEWSLQSFRNLNN